MNYNELRGGANGWVFKGVACKLLVHRDALSVPLYRYWNGRDHFYTTNSREQGSYTYEGVTGYCYPSHVAGTVPLYRYYQPAVVDHFYTRNTNYNGHGYVYEGVACYVFPN
jgi:hypothetical protein